MLIQHFQIVLGVELVDVVVSFSSGFLDVVRLFLMFL